MPQILELAQLAQGHRMAQVDVGGRRVDAELDVERLAALELLERARDSGTICAAPDAMMCSCSSGVSIDALLLFLSNIGGRRFHSIRCCVHYPRPSVTPIGPPYETAAVEVAGGGAGHLRDGVAVVLGHVRARMARPTAWAVSSAFMSVASTIERGDAGREQARASTEATSSSTRVVEVAAAHARR